MLQESFASILNEVASGEQRPQESRRLVLRPSADSELCNPGNDVLALGLSLLICKMGQQ